MILGLTGKNASGKGEVAEFLKRAGYRYYSLSDELRKDLERSSDEVTRDSLTRRGNELRSEFGTGVLAERILKNIPFHMNAVVDSVRNPGEVEVLRCRSDFFLVNVTSDSRVRFDRIKARSRENDPKTYEEFIEVENRENDGRDPIRQQLDMTAELADIELKNNEGIDELYERIRKVVCELSKKVCRPDWNEYFMEMARVASLRGNCLKRKVGAVIVKDRRVISSGYNGTPRGIKNCYEGGCKRCNSLAPSGEGLSSCICSHAEENAIVQAAYHGVSTKDAVIYITFSPCITCTKMIINSGIVGVVYDEAYAIEQESLKLLKSAGVKVHKI